MPKSLPTYHDIEPPKLLYSRRETQLVLGVSSRTIRQMEEDGTLDQIRLTRRPTSQVFHNAQQVHQVASKGVR